MPGYAPYILLKIKKKLKINKKSASSYTSAYKDMLHTYFSQTCSDQQNACGH
jgi:hypothetical protein